MKKFILNALMISESRWTSICENLKKYFTKSVDFASLGHRYVKILKNISQKVLTSLLFGDKINKPCEGSCFSSQNDGSLKTLIKDNSIFEMNTSILETTLNTQ